MNNLSTREKIKKLSISALLAALCFIGTLTIQIKSKITIKVGDKITMTMNGETGAVSIKADSIDLEGTNRVTAKSDTSVKLEAAQVAATASSSLKMESSGTAAVTGSTVSIG